jgi:PHD/YefM family antitoxin component YafN of YafNO toxin-antitoxin module
MNFVTVRDFRTSPKAVWEKLDREGPLVITNNGKPAAIMLEVDGSTLEEKLATIRQAETMRFVNAMRLKSVMNGNSAMSMDEIDSEIAAARAERLANEAKARCKE